MITENLSTLKIHKLTEEQYQRELEAGRIDGSALYLTPDKEIDLSSYATVEQIIDMLPNLYVWKKCTGDPTTYSTENSTNYSIASKLNNTYISYPKIIYADEMQFSDGTFSLVDATLMSTVSLSNMSKLLGKYIIVIPITVTASTSVKSRTCIKIPSDATFSESSYTGESYMTYKRIVASSATVYTGNMKLKYVSSENKSDYPDNGEHTDGYWYVYHKQLGD